jgi:hypothetical protein
MFGERGTKGCGALTRDPGFSNGLAYVGKGNPMPLGPRPLAAAHGGSRPFGGSLVSDASGHVRTAGSLKLGGDGSRPAAGGQLVLEVDFETTGGGFESVVGMGIIQRLAVRADVADCDMVVRIDSPATPALLRVFPYDIGVVLRAQRGKDARHGLVALLVGEARRRGQADVMKGHRRPTAVPQRLHIG